MGSLELNIIDNLKAVRRACTEMLEANSKTFKDNDKLLYISHKASYQAFYETACKILDDYDHAKETEIEEYENYITGGLKE